MPKYLSKERKFNQVVPYTLEENPYEIVDGFMVRKDRYKIEQFIKEATAKHEGRYSYEETVFVPRTTKKDIILVTCPEHGPFSIEIRAHLKGRGCPKCPNRYTKSVGETMIAEWLSDKDIDYVREKSFPRCVNPLTGKRLRYDFYLPDRQLLIEYDDKYHYPKANKNKPPSESTLLKIQDVMIRDRVKENFAKAAGITLVRIPYSSLADLYTILEEQIRLHPVLDSNSMVVSEWLNPI